MTAPSGWSLNCWMVQTLYVIVAGLPQTVGFQASLILIQPGGTEPAQTFCVREIAPRDKGASVGASTGWRSRGSGDWVFAGGGGAGGGLTANPGGTSRVALMMGPGLEVPLLQATRAALKAERVGLSTPTRVP